MKVTAEAARRFLVARHFLAPARSLEGGPEAVLEVFRRLGSVQFDPLAVAGRSHDLVLHARVADYEPAWCDLLYERREIFEAYNKGLSFVPVSEFPWFRGILSRGRRESWTRTPRWPSGSSSGSAPTGPLSSLDFERERGATTDWFGVPTNVVRAVLEAYAVTGVLGLARRDGNRRYYDLLERLLPADVLARDVPLRRATPAQAPVPLPRARPARRRRGRRHLQRPRACEAGPAVARAIPAATRCARSSSSAGELVPVEVEGVRGKRFVLRDEVALLESAARAAALGRVPLPVRRVRVGPRPPREPVRLRLHVGALRPAREAPLGLVRAADRCSATVSSAGSSRGSTGPGRRVQVLDVWWEDGFAPRRAEGFVDAMRDALRAYLALRRREPARVGAAPRDGEAALPHPAVTRGRPLRPPRNVLVDKTKTVCYGNGHGD